MAGRGARVNLLRMINLLMRRLFYTEQASGPVQHDLGKRGEDEAVRYLKAQGFRILERNFRWTGGEIDLVVFKGGIIAFVEVRARTEPVGLEPLFTVTQSKQRKLIRTAHRYVAARHLDREDIAMRFDVITVRYPQAGTAAEVEHIVDAFQA